MRTGRATASAAGLLLLGAAALLSVISCSEDKGTPPTTPPPVSDYAFSLRDVNPNSSTYNQRISPAGFPGKPVVLLAGSAG